MYNTYILIGALVIVAGLLIHFKPLNISGSAIVESAEVEGIEGIEGFATKSVDPIRMPDCINRSTDAQSLLSRIASYPAAHEGASELRLLVSKLCCMEADIATPSAHTVAPRTLHLQFRTSQDIEPPATLVGRCLRNAVNKRDIELIIEKYRGRGVHLIKALCTDDAPAARNELDKVVARLQIAMSTFCLKEQPRMDRPVGARDMGFWEPEEVAELSQYKGISAVA